MTHKPPKSSQAHYLPSLIFFGAMIFFFVWSIIHAINYAITYGTTSDGCSDCGISLYDE